MIERAFRKNGVTDDIHLLSGGAEAIAYLEGQSKFADRAKFQFPSIVITDLKMPALDGFSVLKHIKGNPEWAVIPTIMLSASADTDDIKKAYFFGANSFFSKPATTADLQALLRRLYDYWIQVEVPQTDESGKMFKTESAGKIAESH
ncbi:MAG: response regulator [Limisphaerales bacterium]